MVKKENEDGKQEEKKKSNSILLSGTVQFFRGM